MDGGRTVLLAGIVLLLVSVAGCVDTAPGTADDQGAGDATVEGSDGDGEEAQAPTASFRHVCRDLRCDFDASASTPPEGEKLIFSWNLGDGASAEGSFVSHTYDSAGAYEVILTVRDSTGKADATSQSISVTAPENRAPGAARVSPSAQQSIEAGQEISFSLECTDPDDGDTVRPRWELESDDEIISQEDGEPGEPSVFTHSYVFEREGTYSVEATCIDREGLESSAVTWDVQADRPFSTPPDWPMFGLDPAHTGAWEAGTAHSYSTAWSYEFDIFGGVESPAAVANGVLFISSDLGDLAALDAESGSELWVYEVDGLLRGSPVVSQGVVIVGDTDGIVYALDASTGELKWRFDADVSAFRGSPVIAGGNVVIQSDGIFSTTVMAFDVQTGDRRWKYEASAPMETQIAVVEDRVFTTGGDTLYAFDSDTGSVEWQVDVDGTIEAGPTITDDRILVSTSNRFVQALQISDGAPIWRFEVPGGDIVSTPTVSGDTVFFGANDANVYAVSLSAGQEIWRFTTNKPVQSSPAVAGDTVLVGSDDETLYALNRETGEERWAFNAGGRVESSPIVVSDLVIFGATDGTVHALQLTG